MLGGTTYLATALEAPGLIVQTGVHRSIIFGEVFGVAAPDAMRVQAIADVMAPADIQVTAVARRPHPALGQVRLPRAVLRIHWRRPPADRLIWTHARVREMFYAASREVAAIAAAEGVTISPDRFATLEDYMTNIPGPPVLAVIDLEQGKRIEVEALQGAALRRAAAHGVPVPIIATLYAVLKAWESGNPRT